MKCSSIIEIMEGYASERLALEYDNVGLILGESIKEVKKVLIALDLTDEVAEEAINVDADMIITHHPLIFSPIKKITDETSQGRRIIKLLKNNIAVFAAHTNLDIAIGGTNDALYELLQLTDKENLGDTNEYGTALGRVGKLCYKSSLCNFANFVKSRLKLNTIRVTGELDKIISKAGLCTGSASDPKYLRMAKVQGCDVYITGDVTYHNAQAAKELDIALIDATHYATEIIIIDKLYEYLNKNTSSLEIIKSVKDTGFLYEL